ncbi:MFS transporter [Pseudomonas sp. 09C 129]|uniref:MFS transporter n=1 Tax=unclassified Pseudomonas TaxID=196821 RepID=UPI0002726159|nr:MULTISPECIES: MFS transporter [unclassified Pseudomonas]AUG00010.1 MFS transporter [Pseudomonas sp. 09C 129]WIE51173.1 MFS transporter [Pseudomonas sp. GM17]
MTTLQKAPVLNASAPSRRAIIAITLGNALEFYDFIVYSALATLMGRLFFPFTDEPLLQLMLSLAVFGTGFISRPIGGILIGLYADRRGRKPALRLSLWLMAIGSLLLVIAPTYAQAGLLGPLLVLLARLVQGFAVGGQVGAATSMLMEYANDRTRGYYCSWQLLSQGLGVLCGTLVVALLGAVLSPEAMDSWGWRMVFAVGVLTIPVGEYIRHRLDETAAVSTSSPQGEPAPDQEPAGPLLRQHSRQIIAGVLVAVGATAPTFIISHYLANHAVTLLGMPLSVAIWAASASALLTVLLSVPAGRLSDRIGRRRSILLPRLALLALIYPGFLLLHAMPGLPMLLLVVSLLSVPLVYTSVPSLAVLPELFPRRIRASGMSIVYCLGVMVFGGFAQFFASGLIKLTGDPSSPAWYVMVCILLSLIGLAMVPETAGKALD